MILKVEYLPHKFDNEILFTENEALENGWKTDLFDELKWKFYIFKIIVKQWKKIPFLHEQRKST